MATATDTLSISSIANNANVVLSGVQTANSFILASGTSFENITAGSMTHTTEGKGISLVGGSGAISLVASVATSANSITGSSADDYFDFTVDDSASIYINGGSGVDAYKVASSGGKVIINDFGFADQSGEAADSTKGADVIILKDPENASTKANIKINNGKVQFGNENVYATVASGVSKVYAYIGTSAETAKQYKIGTDGATLAGSDAVAATVNGASGQTSEVTQDHSLFLSSGANTVSGFKSWDGTDSGKRVADLLGNMTADSLSQTSDTNGVRISDGTNNVLLQNVDENKLIRVGNTDADAKAVFLASGDTSLTPAQAAAADMFLGSNNGTLSFKDTAKTTIDLSGNSSADTATYKNVNAIEGSDDGKSLLVSNGETAVKLISAGANDTLDGSTGGNDVLNGGTIGDRTTFKYDASGGKDTIESFSFGADTLKDDVVALTTDMIPDGTAEKLIKASSGVVQIAKAGQTDDVLTLKGDAGVNDFQYNLSGASGVVRADMSASGSKVAFTQNANIFIGQATSTLAGASGDSIGGDDAHSGMGWGSKFLSEGFGTIDMRDVKTPSVNGDNLTNQTIYASTVMGASGDVWICGGIDDGFTNTTNDTLYGAGGASQTVFYVGKDMGADVLNQVVGGDKIVFVGTKVEDLATSMDSVRSGNAFTFNLKTTAGGTNTVKANSSSSLDYTTGITVQFDDASYVWNGVSEGFVKQ